MRESVPHNLDAERAVLGGVLLDNDAIETVANTLGVDDFYGDRNRLVYRAMLDTRIADKPIDASTLADVLGADVERAGSLSYIVGLSDGLPRGNFVDRYAAIVKDKATLRQIINGANSVITEAMNGAGDLDTKVAAFEAATLSRKGAKTDFAVDDGRYTMHSLGIVFAVDFLRRERNQLIGELTVSRGDRTLSAADFQPLKCPRAI